jgi:AcrR family transcriptional regulator
MREARPRTGPERPGRREQKKLETRERIRAAAADLFTRHCYGAATMREIAQRAHVALGTLFNYAEDKRDLVFLIFNEELNALIDVALAAPRPDQSLVEQLLAVFRVHYRWFATKPALARILLQELTFYSSGKQAATFLGIRKRLIDGLEALVRGAQRARRIRSREDPAVIARCIFFVYSASLRWWIAAPRPNPEKGVADLRRLLKLQAAGLR